VLRYPGNKLRVGQQKPDHTQSEVKTLHGINSFAP
jgi:hypothetical protein